MKNQSRYEWTTTWISEECSNEIRGITDLLGVSKHKVTGEAIALGLELAKYKIALERVMEDKLKFRSL